MVKKSDTSATLMLYLSNKAVHIIIFSLSQFALPILLFITDVTLAMQTFQSERLLSIY